MKLKGGRFVQVTFFLMITFVSCKSEKKEDVCPEISDNYASFLKETLAEQGVSQAEDLSYIYSQFDVIQAKMIAGTRQKKKDSLYIEKVFKLKDASKLVKDKVSNAFDKKNINKTFIDESLKEYRGLTVGLIKGVGDPEFVEQCIFDIDERIFQLSTDRLENKSFVQLQIEKYLFLNVIVSVEIICSQHLLWSLATQ